MHAVIARTRWLTPGMVRVTLTGGDLPDLTMPDATDAYINVALPPADAPYGPLFDPAQVRVEHDQQLWPARRRYTVRAWRAEIPEMDVDVVVHGDLGAGGPWAANAKEGDHLVFTGPGGNYRPDPAADWHLMVGDESALPAIAASLEAVPAGARAVVRLLCDGPDYEVPLHSPGDLDVQWLHRTGAATDSTLLLDAVRTSPFPPGAVHAFVHGEADETRAIRAFLLSEHKLSRAALSCSPYWRRTMTEEAWRAVKRDFVTAMASDIPDPIESPALG